MRDLVICDNVENAMMLTMASSDYLHSNHMRIILQGIRNDGTQLSRRHHIQENHRKLEKRRKR